MTPHCDLDFDEAWSQKDQQFKRLKVNVWILEALIVALTLTIAT